MKVARVADEKRLLALKHVVNPLADIHQPLHAGYQEDRWGNSYQLQAFMKGINLHALWDVGLMWAPVRTCMNLAGLKLLMDMETDFKVMPVHGMRG